MASKDKKDLTRNARIAWERSLNDWREVYPTLPTPFLTATHRSNEEQNRLYAQGRTAPGKRVTNARAGQSNHNKYPSPAFDIAFRKKDGSIDWSDHLFKKFAVLAKANGLSWGGDWKSIKDNPHFEYLRNEPVTEAGEVAATKRADLAVVANSPASQPPLLATEESVAGALNASPAPENAQQQPSQTKLEMKDGNLKLETTEGNTPPDKIAVEKPPPKSFGAEIKKDLGVVGLGEVGLQGVREAAEGVKFLGLSARFWLWVSIIALVAGAGYLIAKFYKYRTETQRDLELTNQLITANSTDSNKVVLVDSDRAVEFAKAGYKIVHR